MSYSVQQQTKDIGIRMALGADKNTILAMILRQGLTPAFIGVSAGRPVRIAQMFIVAPLSRTIGWKTCPAFRKA
jgi:ABC-type lipoprotein release transport system permease subunit